MNPYESKMGAFRKRLGDMQSALDQDKGTAPLAKEAGGYKAKSFAGSMPEFDFQRKKANEQIAASASQNQDALTRRFARFGGGLQSGAFVKQAQQADEQAAQQRAQSMEAIGAQEAQARRALEREEAQKEFQSSEAIAGRNAQREQFNADLSFRDRVFKFDSGSKLAALDMQGIGMDQQEQQFREQMALQKSESDFNRKVAMSQMGDDELLAMGAEGDAYREEKARKKGEMENAKNRAKDAARSQYQAMQRRQQNPWSW